jgi:sodium pump decarboxylase gamma subunit
MNANFVAFLEGFSTFFVGVGMVFVALLLLILLIQLTSMVVSKIEGATHHEEVPAQAPQPQEEVIAAEIVDEQDELELVAVITAAIASSLGTTTDKLQVRSLRQINR